MDTIIKPSIMFLLFMAAVITVTAQPGKKNAPRVEVLFNASMTQADLDKIKADLAKKNIKVDFIKTEFDKEGHLSLLNFSVDCNDGFKGGATNADFSSGKKFGFFRDYDKKTKSPFRVGFM